jgi:hypothetical protein
MDFPVNQGKGKISSAFHCLTFITIIASKVRSFLLERYQDL